METSLRCGGGSRSLRIHAKEKFPIDSKTLLQAHGEINTAMGAPSYLAVIIRKFYPELSASMGVGIQYDKHDKISYCIRGKKALPVTSSGLLNINVKGRCDIDKEFRERKTRGALELGWAILNFQKDQDVRIKVGYEVFEKVPYFQIRENNWTLNGDANGKWNGALENQLEELDNQGSSAKTSPDKTAATVDDAVVEDLLDPELMSTLKSIGWADSELDTQSSKKPEPKLNTDKVGSSQIEKVQLEEQIKTEKLRDL